MNSVFDAKGNIWFYQENYSKEIEFIENEINNKVSLVKLILYVHCNFEEIEGKEICIRIFYKNYNEIIENEKQEEAYERICLFLAKNSIKYYNEMEIEIHNLIQKYGMNISNNEKKMEGGEINNETN